MPGSLLYGADGSLVYGSTSGRLLYKPRPSVILTASASTAFMGIAGDSVWSQSAYETARSDAWNDFKADTSLGSAGRHDVTTGLAMEGPYGPSVTSRYYGLRFTFSMTTTQLAHLSSIDILSQYAAWWLIGYRYTAGYARSTQGFLSVSGSLNWRLGGGPYDDGADLIASTPDKTVTWGDINADQTSAGATISAMQWISYPLSGSVVDRVREADETTIYLWAWASSTAPQYLGDKSATFHASDSLSGWEIICGPVNDDIIAGDYKLRVRIGQDA